MNAAHLHLMVNHVPLFALAFGIVALAAAMKRRSADLRVFASVLFLVTGVFAWVGDVTGEEAEDLVEQIDPGAEPQIEAHEEAAEWAVRSGTLVALLALGLEVAVRRKPTWTRRLQWTLMVFAVHGFSVFAATAWQGGQIRHAELRPPTQTTP